MDDKNPLKDYVWNTGNTFEIMRLLVEGAVTLYDDEASPLFRLGRQHGQEKAASAFSIIGTALYELRMHIMNLQDLNAMEMEQKNEKVDTKTNEDFIFPEG